MGKTFFSQKLQTCVNPNSALNGKVVTWFYYFTLLSHEVDICNVVYTGNSLRCQDNMLIKLFKPGHHDTIFAIGHIYQISNRIGTLICNK